MSIAMTRQRFFNALTGLAAAAPLATQDKAIWDLTWVDQFKGKHKQVFDLGSFDVSEDDALRLPNNYLNAFRDVYQAEPPDVNVAVGIARTAFPINAGAPSRGCVRSWSPVSPPASSSYRHI